MDKNKELFKKVEARLHNYKYLQIQIDNLELDIEEIKNDYRGCGSISYDERTGSTYNISRTIENEIIDRERKLSKLLKTKSEKETEKRELAESCNCARIR